MRIRYFLFGFLLTLSFKVFSENWQILSNGYVTTKSENTKDIIGINICNQNIAFVAPSLGDPEGTISIIKPQMRVDLISPWEGEVIAKVNNGYVWTFINLTPEFFNELIRGKVLRIKWAENVYSRFNLEGLAFALQNTSCPDSQDDDADYFT